MKTFQLRVEIGTVLLVRMVRQGRIQRKVVTRKKVAFQKRNFKFELIKECNALQHSF